MPVPSSLTAADVRYAYPGRDILSGIDLTITHGQPPLGLVGASGAGKTTLLHILAGKVRPDSGGVTFDDRGVFKMRGKDGKRFTALVRHMSQYAMTISDPRETPGGRLKTAASQARKAGRTHAFSPAEMLAAVGLEERFLGRTMMSLSGGEKQRVALAVALATRPEILLLDEPLTAVDPGTRSEIARTITDTAERLGTSVLVASHDLELVQQMCPEVVFLADGQLVARGSLPQLLSERPHPAIAELASYAAQAVQRFR